MTQAALIALLQRRVKYTGSQKAVAKALGVSPQYLHDVLKGRREPGDKILKALKLRKIIIYERLF